MVSEKISSAFRSRLESRSPTDVVRAILVFDVRDIMGSSVASAATGRKTPADRRAIAKRLVQATPALNATIDQLLQRYHATRMSESLTPLGTLLVEAPASEFLQLEGEPLVRAVLDDQTVMLPSDAQKPRK